MTGKSCRGTGSKGSTLTPISHEESRGEGCPPQQQTWSLLQALPGEVKGSHFCLPMFAIPECPIQSLLECRENRTLCLSSRAVWNSSQYRAAWVCLRTKESKECFWESSPSKHSRIAVTMEDSEAESYPAPFDKQSCLKKHWISHWSLRVRRTE